MITVREAACLSIGLLAGATVVLLTRRRPRRVARLTRRVNDCKPLPIKEIAAMVANKISGGAKIVNMSQGVPCLQTFRPCENEMIALISGRSLPYSPVPGIDVVRATCVRPCNANHVPQPAVSQHPHTLGRLRLSTTRSVWMARLRRSTSL